MIAASSRGVYDPRQPLAGQMGADWMPIEYRDFYDVPRVFLIRNASGCILFDCPFADEADAYPAVYHVYAFGACPDPRHLDSWEGLQAHGTHLGEIAVMDVVFDETRRRAVERRSVARFLGE